MRAGAASGESFGVDAGKATWLHSAARNAAAQKGMARKRPFSYDVEPLPLIRIEEQCEVRAFPEERRGNWQSPPM